MSDYKVLAFAIPSEHMTAKARMQRVRHLAQKVADVLDADQPLDIHVVLDKFEAASATSTEISLLVLAGSERTRAHDSGAWLVEALEELRRRIYEIDRAAGRHA